MIIILFIIMIFLFPLSLVFIKKESLKRLFGIITLFIILGCEGLMVVNDTKYFGMDIKQEEVSTNISSSSKNQNILYYSSETIMPVYQYQIKGQDQVTLPTDKVIIHKDANNNQASIKMINSNLYFKNNFYAFLYGLIRTNGETISSKITFDLPSNWKLEKSLTIGQ